MIISTADMVLQLFKNTKRDKTKKSPFAIWKWSISCVGFSVHLRPPFYLSPFGSTRDKSVYSNRILTWQIIPFAFQLFNTMDSPERERSKMAPTVSSTPARRTYGSMQPHNTSLDMNSSIYDNVGFGSSPQPLIRAIKDELFRLSQTAKGRTQIQNLRDSQGDRPPPVTWSQILRRNIASIQWMPSHCFAWDVQGFLANLRRRTT